MNTELAGSALWARGKRLVVLEGGEVAGGLARDVVEVLTGSVLAGTAGGRRGIVR